MFLWNRKGKLTSDIERLDARVTSLETELLRMLKSIDSRIARLENHMSHIVEGAFNSDQIRDPE